MLLNESKYILYDNNHIHFIDDLLHKLMCDEIDEYLAEIRKVRDIQNLNLSPFFFSFRYAYFLHSGLILLISIYPTMQHY